MQIFHTRQAVHNYSSPESNSTTSFAKDTLTKSYCKRLVIVLTLFLFLAAATGLILACIMTFDRTVLFPIYTTTTTKVSGSLILNIGQLCQWHNQCPQYAYCSNTCKCPESYYFDPIAGSCKAKKTINVTCTYDYECNNLVRLSCVSSMCQCESVTTFWNSAYSNGGGVVSGRCQNKYTYGFSTTDTTQIYANTILTSSYGATSRVICSDGYKLNLNTGYCSKAYFNDYCTLSYECYQVYSFCLDPGDGVSRCVPIPTYGWLYDWYQKGNSLTSACSEYKLCNEYQTLVCANSVGSGLGLTCTCPNSYYVFNSTSFCVYGSRYGETCTSSTDCVPTSAGLTCAVPYTGAGYKVCRCTSSSKFYDPYQEVCKSFKQFNSTCLDSSECQDTSTSTGYCGYVPGGAIARCLCTDDAYLDTTTKKCVAKTGSCTSASTIPSECYNNMVCSGGTCTCATYKYQSTSNICLYKGYPGDTCSSTYSNNDCVTGSTCTNSVCT